MGRLVFVLLIVCGAFHLNLGNILPPTKVISREGRIIGGQDAAPGQFPYQASVRYRNTNRHFCGASILNKYWLLTAAHCTKGDSPTDLIVVVSSHLLTGGISHRVAQNIVNPDYDEKSIENDVACLETETEIIFDEFTKPIPLINRVVEEGTLYLTGWGRLSEGGAQPANLQYLETYPVPLSQCKEEIPANDDTFCAFNSEGRGSCFGDSGGPLALPDEGLVGISSYIINTCGGGYYDAFASVYYHRDWILRFIS